MCAEKGCVGKLYEENPVKEAGCDSNVKKLLMKMGLKLCVKVKNG